MLINKTLVYVCLVSIITLSGCIATKIDVLDEKSTQALASLTETYWKLTQLNGKAVVMASGQQSERHFTLHNNEGRIAGFSGCNRFFGEFKSTPNSQDQGELKFGTLGSTMMACPEVKINDHQLFNVFENTTSYKITTGSLTLFNHKGLELARFNAVYF